MKIKSEDVVQQLERLAAIGGTPEGGTTRLLYTPQWLEAQQMLKSTFEQAQFRCYFDAVGNLFGRVEGSRYPQQVIMSGSHVDTVVNGGRLDGQYGIVAAFVALRQLVATYGPPLKSVEVVALAEEEGSRFPYVFWGSKNLMGLAQPQEVRQIQDGAGVNFATAMSQCGFTLPEGPLPPRRDIAAFLEIHIEQGCVLEQQRQQIGIVTAIVGQRRYTVRLKGEANHAGTTPMNYRHDTVYAFSRICSRTVEKANAIGDPLVVTFGRVEPQPNTVNVVPGETLFTLDCRHTDSQLLAAFTDEIERDIRDIANESGMTVEIDQWMDEAPVPMNPPLLEMLEKLCQQQQRNYRRMHSGAGHDSQIIAPQVPTAMLFVPSIAGISHNPKEATAADDLTAGVEVLAAALYQLAWQDSPNGGVL